MVNYNSTDNCVIGACNITVTSNEPVGNTGSGNTLADWEVINDHQVNLRAERGGGNNRSYTLSVNCIDAAGNQSVPVSTEVVVTNTGSAKQLMVVASPNASTADFAVIIQGINKNEKITVTLYNTLGRKVEQKSGFFIGQKILMGSHLAPGIYFAEVAQGANKVFIKLIKL
ncbi:MAG: T9SS type A sorting domain-containing protein [Bacteroidota bacterium]